MNDDGDWWVAVEDVSSLAEARDVVVGCLSYEIPEDGRLAYLGKSVTRLCEADPHHEVGPGCDTSCDRTVLAYHFEERRKW